MVLQRGERGMYTPHKVTLYHQIEDDITAETTYNITVLDGVFLDIAQGTNITKSGMGDADSATLFIPISVNAYDPETGKTKQFLPPKEFARQADHTSYWTLETGGKSSGADCYFVKGVVIDPLSYGKMRDKYDYVFDITTVDLKDFGRDRMQHWQVGGK